MNKTLYKWQYLIVLITLIFFIKEAHVSQVFLNEIKLKELIERSDFIVIVKELDPKSNTEEVIICEDENKCPSYSKETYNFEVIEILFKDEDKYTMFEGYKDPFIQKEIKVLPANYSQDLELHKKYYLEHRRKSYQEDVYGFKKGSKGKQSIEKILFLVYNPSESSLEYTVTGSFDSIKKKKKVIKYIKKLKQNKYKD